MWLKVEHSGVVLAASGFFEYAVRDEAANCSAQDDGLCV
jgi:hypothetical protein